MGPLSSLVRGMDPPMLSAISGYLRHWDKILIDFYETVETGLDSHLLNDNKLTQLLT